MGPGGISPDAMDALLRAVRAYGIESWCESPTITATYTTSTPGDWVWRPVSTTYDYQSPRFSRINDPVWVDFAFEEKTPDACTEEELDGFIGLEIRK